MRAATLVIFITVLCARLSWAQSGGSVSGNTILVLPSILYTDEAGPTLGANGVWFGVGGSTWDAAMDGNFTSQFPRNEANLTLVNKKLLDAWYVQLHGRYLEASRSFFYGIGNGTGDGQKAAYGIHQRDLGGEFGYNVGDVFFFGTGLNYENTGVDQGSDPSLQTVSGAYSSLPRLGGSLLTTLSFFARFDNRAPVPDTHSGQWAGIKYDTSQAYLSSGLGMNRFSFDAGTYLMLDDLIKPLVEAKGLTGALRVQGQRVWGSGIPFYALPRIGGMNTLRAFRPGRWTDQGSLVINLETRYAAFDLGGSVFKRLDIAPFIDTGRVYASEGQYGFDGLEFNTGVSFIALLGDGLPLRLDYAIGPEGNLLYLHLLNSF